MSPPQRAYREAQGDEAPACRAGYPGCFGLARIYIPCKVEGTQVPACMHCSEEWKQRARGNPELAMRCPLCATLQQRPGPAAQDSRGAALAAALPPPLQGAAAVAMAEAMLREGIPGPTRQRVLQRLARDAPWLERASAWDAVEVP